MLKTNLQKFINKIVSEYLENIDFSDMDDPDDIASAIDSEDLSRKISAHLEQFELKFVPTVRISDDKLSSIRQGSSLYCDKCGKTFGAWHSKHGSSIPTNLVETNNKKIILIDDVI